MGMGDFGRPSLSTKLLYEAKTKKGAVLFSLQLTIPNFGQLRGIRGKITVFFIFNR